jgi:multiple sugar transport system permease protein
MSTQSRVMQIPEIKLQANWVKKLFTAETLVAALFIAPSLFGLFIFFIRPTLQGFYLSLTDSDLLTHANFIGLKNYERLLQDKQFVNSLLITVKYVLLNIPLQTVLALGLAVLLVRLTQSMTLRGLVLLPWLIPILMATLIWISILSSIGPAESVLKMLGLPPICFMCQDYIIPSIAWINIWRHTGYNTLLFFAGLQTIPKEMYEAAAIDGAGEWRTFRSVTLPLLRPVTVFILVTSFVGSFQVYDSVAVTAVPVGGPGGATRVIYWYILDLAFNRFNMGYATTVAVALFVISLAIAIVQLWYFRVNTSDLG